MRTLTKEERKFMADELIAFTKDMKKNYNKVGNAIEKNSENWGFVLPDKKLSEIRMETEENLAKVTSHPILIKECSKRHDTKVEISECIKQTLPHKELLGHIFLKFIFCYADPDSRAKKIDRLAEEGELLDF